MVIVALLLIARKWKQYNGILFGNLINVIQIYAITWMNLHNFMSGERSQLEGTIFFIILLHGLSSMSGCLGLRGR